MYFQEKHDYIQNLKTLIMLLSLTLCNHRIVPHLTTISNYAEEKRNKGLAS